MNDIIIESFINFCDDMIIAEEGYQFPTDKLLPAIVKDTELAPAANNFLEKISLQFTLSDALKFYEYVLPQESIEHIVENHTLRSFTEAGNLIEKSKYARETMKNHAEKCGVFFFKKDAFTSFRKIQATILTYLNYIYKKHMYEIANFQYAPLHKLRSFYNNDKMRYEYYIDHEFTKPIGKVWVKGGKTVGTKIVRLILAMDSPHQIPRVVSMYPILKNN